VRTHIKAGWILLYIERWLTAPFETAEGEQLETVKKLGATPPAIEVDGLNSGSTFR
jgi:hypothetical protein